MIKSKSYTRPNTNDASNDEIIWSHFKKTGTESEYALYLQNQEILSLLRKLSEKTVSREEFEEVKRIAKLARDCSVRID
jgi:hypothetical protein